jgi:hypothetical protein
LGGASARRAVEVVSDPGTMRWAVCGYDEHGYTGRTHGEILSQLSRKHHVSKERALAARTTEMSEVSLDQVLAHKIQSSDSFVIV